MSEPWMLEMSKHSMRLRARPRGRGGRAAPAGSPATAGAGASTRARRPAARCGRRARAGAASRPRCGTWIRTAVPRRAREPRLEQLAVGDLLGHDDLARHVAPARVELLQRRGEHRLGLGQAVEQEALARHHLAVAHAEDLHRRALALDVRGEEVALLDVGGRDLLRRLEPHQGLHLVAQRRRLLVALARRRAPPSARAGAASPPRCAPRGRAARPRSARR